MSMGPKRGPEPAFAVLILLRRASHHPVGADMVYVTWIQKTSLRSVEEAIKVSIPFIDRVERRNGGEGIIEGHMILGRHMLCRFSKECSVEKPMKIPWWAWLFHIGIFLPSWIAGSVT